MFSLFLLFSFCSCVRTVKEKPSIPPAENVIEFPTEFKPFSFEDEDCNYCDARYIDGFEDDASVLPKIKNYFIDEKTNNLLYRNANNEVKAIARLPQPASVCAVVGNYIFILTDSALYRLKVDFNGGFDKDDFWLVADVPGFSSKYI